jgi:hypothetical protein
MQGKNKYQSESFQINFQTMNQATEWLIVEAMRIRIRSAIMGRTEKVTSTNQIKMMIPFEWRDKAFKSDMAKIDQEFSAKRIRCQEQTGNLSSDKFNEALDQYADDTFQAIWNLLFRIGKLPQKSQISEE